MQVVVNQFHSDYSAWQSLSDNTDSRGDKIQLYHTFLKFMKQTPTSCPDKVRVGKLGVGGWDVCITPPFNLNSGCLVYSFGVEDVLRFEEDLAGVYNCMVRYYDPRIDLAQITDIKDKKQRNNIEFYRVGLGAANGVHPDHEDWTLQTFGAMLQSNQEQQTTIDLLKMDMEYDEWEILKTMFVEKSLTNVKQLALEIHFNEPKDMNTEAYHHMFEVLRELEVIGFMKYTVEPHPYYYEIFKLYYLNSRYFK